MPDTGVSAMFDDQTIGYAQMVQKRYHIPASVVLAQYAQESGYGRKTVGKNNYFNIKGTGTKGYKDYASKKDAFLDYGRLLSKERYTSKTKNATSLKEYVQGIKNAGYATDKNYVSNVITIINSYDLTKYDSVHFKNGTGVVKGLSNVHYETDEDGVSHIVDSPTGSNVTTIWDMGNNLFSGIVKVVIVLLLVFGVLFFFTSAIGGKMQTPSDLIKGGLKNV